MPNRKYLILGVIGAFILLLLLPLLLSACMKGCSTKKTTTTKNGNTNAVVVTETKKLVVWGLYDEATLYEGIFQQFETAHPGTSVEYHKFTNAIEYRNLLINSIAEGKGPDVAMVHNTWLLKDKNKFAPFEVGKTKVPMDVKKFQETYVGVASDDLILPDETGTESIYGFPASVDSLALYFNAQYFRDYVLSSTIPADLWNNGGVNDIISQVVKINHPDLSFERFTPSGIALGRSDNIKYAFDIVSLLLLQYGGQLYDKDMKLATLSTYSIPKQETGEMVYPALNALQFFTNFGISSLKENSWNDMITKKEKSEYEIGTFASGKTAMICGYASTLDQIKQSMSDKKSKGKKTIMEDSVRVASIPQVSQGSRISYASYYPFVVPRTSVNKSDAWDLILMLVDVSAQEMYWEKAHKPTSLSALIDKESLDPVYGIFAQQASYARSLRLVDDEKVKQIFAKMVMDVVNGVVDTRLSLANANIKLQCLLDQYNKVEGKEGVNCLGEGTST